ncbi:hypothetical protein LIER_31077 [Lithospermum erythrorhizon]|uniref:Uncharacterized protein n=1 Tax=Lithospermum erythrorhizon TaxID=34254 RepID=A0AAV3RQT9_LITER
MPAGRQGSFASLQLMERLRLLQELARCELRLCNSQSCQHHPPRRIEGLKNRSHDRFNLSCNIPRRKQAHRPHSIRHRELTPAPGASRTTRSLEEYQGPSPICPL